LTWSVAPARADRPDGRPALSYKLDPGARLTDHVAVTNHSRRPITLRLYASDAFTTASGGFDLLAGAAKPAGAGSWLRPQRSRLDIPAATRVIVPVTVAVPTTATPGDHAGGVVASLAAAGTDATGNQVAVDHRVGTRVYLRVTGELQPRFTISDVRVTTESAWHPFRLPRVRVDYTVRNTGNVRLAGRPSVGTGTLFGLRRRVTGQPELPQILPGGTVRATTRPEGVLPLLRVWVTAAVQPVPADGRDMRPVPASAAAQTAIWVLPWPQSALLVVLLAVVVLIRLRRRRNHRRLRDALAAAERRGRAQAAEDASVPSSPEHPAGPGATGPAPAEEKAGQQ
jgi:hypothetical protein